MRAALAACLLIAAAAGANADDMAVIEMELRDGVVTPQHIEVTAGQPFKLVLKNTGTSAAEFESLRLRKEKVLAPGVESFVVFRKLSPGSYDFYDEFHMDMDSARGTITAR